MLHKSDPGFTESFHWIDYKHAAQTKQRNYSNIMMQSLKSPVPRTWSEQIWQQESRCYVRVLRVCAAQASALCLITIQIQSWMVKVVRKVNVEKNRIICIASGFRPPKITMILSQVKNARNLFCFAGCFFNSRLCILNFGFGYTTKNCDFFFSPLLGGGKLGFNLASTILWLIPTAVQRSWCFSVHITKPF